MTKKGQSLFEHLFESSADAQLVICDGVILQQNESASVLFGESIENINRLFEYSPEFQPNGEKSAKLGQQLLLEASVNGTARFEWLHKIKGAELWKEYVLNRISVNDKVCIHAIIRGIDTYKKQHLRTNQRIERMILQNQVIGDLSALESSELFTLDHFQQQVCKKTAEVMHVSQVIIWSILEDGTVIRSAGYSKKDHMTLPHHLELNTLPRFRKALKDYVPLIINDASKDARINEIINKDDEASLIVIPLLNEGHLRGFLWIERWNKTGTWALEETSFAIALCEMISKQIGASQKQETELILEQKEKRFKALVDHSLDVVCIIDSKGKFTYQSPSFYNLLGYRKSLIGKSSFEFIDTDDRKRLMFRFYRLANTPDSENAFTFRAKLNSNWRYIEALARNLLNDKAISGIVVNFRDVTERMTFQKQLRIKERYYRTLIEKSLDITAIRDVRGITTYISPSIEYVFGIKDTLLLGKTLNDLLHEDDREQAARDWQFILKNPGTPLNFEQRVILPNGDVRHVQGTARNLLEDSTINGVVSNFRDITAKHDAETALIDSQLRLEGIISSAMDAIITVDEGHRIVLFNTAAEKMFNYPAFEIFGKPIDILLSKKTYQHYKKEVNSLNENTIGSRKMSLDDGENYLQGVKGDKKYFPIDASISRQKIDNEIFFTSIIRDISEQIKSEDLLKNYSKDLEKEVKRRTKQLHSKNAELNEAMTDLKNAQEQLIESEKMASLGQLTAGIAHEINNPINFVSSTITPLKRDLNEVRELVEGELGKKGNGSQQNDVAFLFSEISQLLNGIEEGAKRTKNIVLGLRKFSRLDENVFKKVDIHEGLDSTIMLLNSKLGSIKIEKKYKKLPPVECLPGKINQVFMNVISNALHAIKDKGTITITSKKGTHNTVEISISDTGVGMTPAIKKRIFEPFFTTKDVGVGTGLGLSISYGIIENHNGKISVKSEKGKGTKFVISLPVSQL